MTPPMTPTPAVSAKEKARERIEAIADILKQRDEALFTGDAYEADDDEREDTAEVILATLSATEGEAEPVAWRHPTAGWVSPDRGTIAMHCKKSEAPEPLYASPPSAPAGVKVKPLEWRHEIIGCGTPLRQSSWSADRYQIVESPSGKFDLRLGAYAICNTLEEAKAAAQTDYESRIVSALEVPR